MRSGHGCSAAQAEARECGCGCGAGRGGGQYRRTGVPATQATSSDRSTTVAEFPVAATRIDERIDDFLGSSYSGALDNVRAALVWVDGEPVVERCFDSSAEATSNVFSVTKSVMSILVGIALDEGHIGSVDQSLGQLLPSHVDTMAPEVEAVTLHQVLTMTAGLPEDPGSGGIGGIAAEVATADDWVTAILSEEPQRPPGEGFGYSSAGSHLLSAIVAEATGRSVLDYARDKLFDPLGIDSTSATEIVAREENVEAYEAADFAWPVAPEGYHVGYSLLKLTAPDMAKIGQLMLHGGQWNGTQVVSEEWVQKSTHPHVPADGVADHYGYQWWVTDAAGHPAFAAAGFQGQLIEVVPDLGLVVVVSSVDAIGGNASAAAYAALVSYVIAPALSDRADG